MTLQDDIEAIYKLHEKQTIFGRDSNVNTFGNFDGDNRAFINATPQMVSIIRRLEANRAKLESELVHLTGDLWSEETKAQAARLLETTRS